MTEVHFETVADGEAGMRLDRWFAARYPQLGFGRLQKLIRTGQVRLDGSRARTNTRLEAGQTVRVPPIEEAPPRSGPDVRPADARFLRSILLYEDDDIYVFNKPHGLATQGGTGQTRHMDGLLRSLPNRQGEPPRLVHRLDRDTSGCLVVAKTRAAASHFSGVFRSRSARKIYWAVVAGVPQPRQGRISCFLRKQGTGDGEQMVVAEQGEPGAVHSMSHYAVIDTAGRRFAWVSLKPVTGRTHQLRVHMARLGTPIIGDPRYFRLPGWEQPEAFGGGLHLHARRISLPLRTGRQLDVSAPLPAHMLETFGALGFDPDRYDAQDEDPEEA